MPNSHRPHPPARSPRPIAQALRAGLLSLALLGLGWAGVANAADATPTADSSAKNDGLPSVLQDAVQSGQIKVIKQFDTQKSGMTGYVIEEHGRHQVVYSEDGYLFLGELISPDGDNLNAAYTEKYVPKPNVGAVIKKLEKTGHLVTQGPADAPLLYVFADPNCIYCHRFYESAEPLVKAGRLQLRWALVGFLKSSSVGRAAAILSAEDPAAALVRNEASFNDSQEEGAIPPLKSPSPALKKIINTHYKQMAAAGGEGTPTVLYRTSDNHWAVKHGLPPKAWLESYAAGKK